MTVSCISGGSGLGNKVSASPSAPTGCAGAVAPRDDVEIEAEVGLAGNADLAADEPVDLGVEMDGAGFDVCGDAVSWTGKATLVFVAEVHQRAKRQAARGWETAWDRQ